MPRVWIVLLNWNNYTDSRRCLASLARSTYPNFKVVVVDNASSDQSGQMLQAEFPGLQFVFNRENLGFARGCNVGIRASLEDPECRFVLLLNNDSEVEPGFLEPAIALAMNKSRVGALGGKVLMGESRLWYAGGSIDRWRGQARTRGFGEPDHGQYDRVEEVGFVTGALMLVPRGVLEEVGLLPDEYFFGFEEYDYSLTLLRRGYRLYYCPAFRVHHRGDGSHRNWDPKFVYNAYRNKLIFQQKFLTRPLFLLWVIFFQTYAYWFGDRWRRHWIKEYAYLGQKLPAREGFDFALTEALRDHNRVPLCEKALQDFERRWLARSSAAC